MNKERLKQNRKRRNQTGVELQMAGKWILKRTENEMKIEKKTTKENKNMKEASTTNGEQTKLTPIIGLCEKSTKTKKQEILTLKTIRLNSYFLLFE
jgi:hypothetical protein